MLSGILHRYIKDDYERKKSAGDPSAVLDVHPLHVRRHVSAHCAARQSLRSRPFPVFRTIAVQGTCRICTHRRQKHSDEYARRVQRFKSCSVIFFVCLRKRKITVQNYSGIILIGFSTALELTPVLTGVEASNEGVLRRFLLVGYILLCLWLYFPLDTMLLNPVVSALNRNRSPQIHLSQSFFLSWNAVRSTTLERAVLGCINQSGIV